MTGLLSSTYLHAWDWLAIVTFLIISIVVSLYFAKRSGKNIESFFVAGRSLPWYIAGISAIATNFASDTPLWVTSLVRKYGIHALWQYWAMFIGGTLGTVYFARLWRRANVITDVEFLELRYSGKGAAALRLWTGFTASVIYCPLIIAWVTKAMETICHETLALPPEFQSWTIVIIMLVAVLTCAISGLYGVVYTDLIQFIVATGGTLLLAIFAVREVGGFSVLLEQLSNMKEWSGHELVIAPKLGSASDGGMSIWNILGYFGLLWFVATWSGWGKEIQRLLACKDSRHATFSAALNVAVYWGILAWPWIIVALCSLILIPSVDTAGSEDAAYPRMIMTILPIGIRGLLIAALIAAFISTINTLFNWGSSYLVNDIYKRFFIRNAAERHYVWVGRFLTVLLAAAGGYISTMAEDIQQLLEISYVLFGTLHFIHLLRWIWPRLNAAGEITASVAGCIFTPMLLAGKLNFITNRLFSIPEDVLFHKDYDYLGARILFMLVTVILAAVIASLLTKPTDPDQLSEFIKRVRPLRFFWGRISDQYNIRYQPIETFLGTMLSWMIFLACVACLIFGIGKVLLGSPVLGAGCLIVSMVTGCVTIRRVNKIYEKEMATRN